MVSIEKLKYVHAHLSDFNIDDRSGDTTSTFVLSIFMNELRPFLQYVRSMWLDTVKLVYIDMNYERHATCFW